MSRLIAMLAVLIGLLFFAIGWAIGVSFWEDFIFAIGIIVAMVPEGLLPTLTLALVLATQRMAKRNVLIRYLPSVETLGSTTVICTDKTGTLTQNRMTVKQLLLGETLESMADLVQRQSFVERYRPFFLTAYLCHDLKEGEAARQKSLSWGPHGDRTRRHGAASPAHSDALIPKLDEIPFDADRMRLTLVHELPEGPTALCKGAPETVLPLCSTFLTDGETVPLSREVRERVLEAQEAMAEQGLRVIALAYRSLKPQWQHEHLEEDLVFTGLVGLEDPSATRSAGSPSQMPRGGHPGHHGHRRPSPHGEGDRPRNRASPVG